MKRSLCQTILKKKKNKKMCDGNAFVVHTVNDKSIVSSVQRKRRTSRREITVARHTPTPFAIYLIVCEVNWSEIAQCTTHYSYCYYYFCSTSTSSPGSAIVAMPSSHQVDVHPIPLVRPIPLRVEALLRFYYLWMCVVADVHCIQIIWCTQREQRARQSKERPGSQPGQLGEPKLN